MRCMSKILQLRVPLLVVLIVLGVAVIATVVSIVVVYTGKLEGDDNTPEDLSGDTNLSCPTDKMIPSPSLQPDR